jgi:hypothetical protein
MFIEMYECVPRVRLRLLTGGRQCRCPGGMPSHSPDVQVLQHCL